MKTNATIKLFITFLLFGLTQNLFAQNNVSLGNNAGTQGNNSINIGHEAGQFNTQTLNLNVGYRAGKVNIGVNNSFIGYESGTLNTSGNNNSFLGFRSGYANTTGYQNTFIGSLTGFVNTTGRGNTFLGFMAGNSNTAGLNNTFIGILAGRFNNSGHYNVAIGSGAGLNITTGKNNTYIGNAAGNNNVIGEYNVFIGNDAGANELGSNKLYIANSNTSIPLIYGEFDNNKLTLNGKVSIGTQNFPSSIGSANLADFNLYVKGDILTEELRIRTGWADYVFNDDYKLMNLEKLENYIQENNHLPNVPSEDEVLKEGLEVGNILKIQQEKIEELTLYIIELNKKLEKLENKTN